MKLYITRDYPSPHHVSMSTGIYHNIGEDMPFRHITIQIAGIGSIELIWTPRHSTN